MNILPVLVHIIRFILRSVRMATFLIPFCTASATCRIQGHCPHLHACPPWIPPTQQRLCHADNPHPRPWVRLVWFCCIMHGDSCAVLDCCPEADSALLCWSNISLLNFKRYFLCHWALCLFKVASTPSPSSSLFTLSSIGMWRSPLNWTRSSVNDA